MKPITPDEVVKQRLEEIPDTVISVINQLIKEHWTGYSANITITELTKALKAATGHSTIPSSWYDFEPLYEKAGWEVVYDRPGYCESYDTNWTFRRK